jgi:hypothetical protein
VFVPGIFLKTVRVSRCRRQLRRNLFYPEYVDMETDALGDAMNREMIQFLEVTLQSLIIAAVEHLRKHSGAGPVRRVVPVDFEVLWKNGL